LVDYPGTSTTFVGTGSPNPMLWVPEINQVQDINARTALLKIQQWAQVLQEAGFTQISHTYAWTGTVVVPSGATGYLPPFFMPAVCMLLGVMTLDRAGSCTLSIEQDGSVIATGVPVGTSPAFTSITAEVAANDYFQPVVTATSGADGLTCSFYFAAS